MTVYEKTLKSGLISQEEFAEVNAKAKKTKAAKEKYVKADKAKITKAELIAIIEDLK